jgi:hypothetical protein
MRQMALGQSYGASSTASARTIAVPGSVTWTARTSARSWFIVAWPGTVPGTARDAMRNPNWRLPPRAPRSEESMPYPGTAGHADERHLAELLGCVQVVGRGSFEGLRTPDMTEQERTARLEGILEKWQRVLARYENDKSRHGGMRRPRGDTPEAKDGALGRAGGSGPDVDHSCGRYHGPHGDPCHGWLRERAAVRRAGQAPRETAPAALLLPAAGGGAGADGGPVRLLGPPVWRHQRAPGPRRGEPGEHRGAGPGACGATRYRARRLSWGSDHPVPD